MACELPLVIDDGIDRLNGGRLHGEFVKKGYNGFFVGNGDIEPCNSECFCPADGITDHAGICYIENGIMVWKPKQPTCRIVDKRRVRIINGEADKPEDFCRFRHAIPSIRLTESC